MASRAHIFSSHVYKAGFVPYFLETASVPKQSGTLQVQVLESGSSKRLLKDTINHRSHPHYKKLLEEQALQMVSHWHWPAVN